VVFIPNTVRLIAIVGQSSLVLCIAIGKISQHLAMLADLFVLEIPVLVAQYILENPIHYLYPSLATQRQALTLQLQAIIHLEQGR
jgi:hypothetical protein